MIIKEAILQKAQDINEKRRALRDYISTCLRAEICPRCGNELSSFLRSELVRYRCGKCNDTYEV